MKFDKNAVREILLAIESSDADPREMLEIEVCSPAPQRRSRGSTTRTPNWEDPAPSICSSIAKASGGNRSLAAHRGAAKSGEASGKHGRMGRFGRGRGPDPRDDRGVEWRRGGRAMSALVLAQVPRFSCSFLSQIRKNND